MMGLHLEPWINIGMYQVGPETSNIFSEILGLERVTWGEEKEIPRKVEFEEVKNHSQRSMKQFTF